MLDKDSFKINFTCFFFFNATIRTLEVTYVAHIIFLLANIGVESVLAECLAHSRHSINIC